MKRKKIIIVVLVTFFLAVAVLTILNFIWIKKYAKVDDTELVGTYFFEDEVYTDTLVLFNDSSTKHIFVDKRNNSVKIKFGKWTSFMPGVLTIENYSFSEMNYPVDFTFYKNFFWNLKIRFNMYDIYTKKR